MDIHQARLRTNSCIHQAIDILDSHGNLKVEANLTTKASDVNHQRQHHANQMKIKDLEQHRMVAESSASKIRELEGTTAELRSSEERHLQQLAKTQTSDVNRQRQHHANQMKIKDLEQRRVVAEGSPSMIRELKEANTGLRSSEKRHLEQHSMHRNRMCELEQQLAKTRTSNVNHQRQHHANQVKIKDLEQRLVVAENSTFRIRELEEANAELRSSEEWHLEQHGMNGIRICELEQQLAKMQASDVNHQCQHHANQMKINDLEQHRMAAERSTLDLKRELGKVRADKGVGQLALTVSEECEQYLLKGAGENVGLRAAVTTPLPKERSQLLKEDRKARQRGLQDLAELRHVNEAESCSEIAALQHLSNLAIGDFHKIKGKLSKVGSELEELLLHVGQPNLHLVRRQELEGLLRVARSTEQTLRQCIVDLEQRLKVARQAEEGKSSTEPFGPRGLNGHKDNGNQERSLHLSKIRELEEANAELRSSEDRHLQQHSVHRNRISELEQQLAKMQARDVNHQGQHHANQMKIKDLEQHRIVAESAASMIRELEETNAELRSSEERHLQQHSMHHDRICELKQQLAKMQTSDVNHQRQHHANQMKIKDLEQRCTVAESSTSRIRELEDANAELRSSEEWHLQQQSLHHSHVRELEQQLAKTQASDVHHQRQHQANQMKINDLEQRLMAAERSALDLKQELGKVGADNGVGHLVMTVSEECKQHLLKGAGGNVPT